MRSTRKARILAAVAVEASSDAENQQTTLALVPSASAESSPSPKDETRHVKDILQQLLTWSELHPNLARHLDQSIVAMRWELKRSPRKDRDSVLFALERSEGGMAVEDLEYDTQLSPEELKTILDEFIGAGLAEKRPSGRLTSAKQGRIEYLYALTHKSAFSAPSASRAHHSCTAAMMKSIDD